METFQVILIAVGILALALFLLKFGKALVILALVAGVIVVVVVGAMTFLPGETRQPVEPTADTRGTIARARDTIEDTAQTLDNMRQTTGNVERATDSIGRTAEKVERAAVGFFRNLVFGILSIALLAALAVIGYLGIRLKLAAGTLRPLQFPRRESRREVEYKPVVYIIKASDESEVDQWIDENYFQF